jgi:hypothetical protein
MYYYGRSCDIFVNRTKYWMTIYLIVYNIDMLQIWLAPTAWFIRVDWPYCWLDKELVLPMTIRTFLAMKGGLGTDHQVIITLAETKKN